MMKRFKYIVALTALAVGLPMLAQEVEPDTIITKEYVYKDTQYVSVCSIELPYKWRAKRYYDAGIYNDTVKVRETEINDTIYTLKLSVIQSYEIHEHVRFCPGDRVVHRGRVYNTETVDSMHIASSTQCDSIIYIHAHMSPSTYQILEREICKGDPFIWHKQTGDTLLSKTGYYYDSCLNQYGCDSITCLHLMVSEKVIFEDSVSLCEEYLPYKFGGKKLYVSGVYYDTIVRGSDLCDSIVCLKFTALKDEHVDKTIKFCSTVGAVHNSGKRFYSDTMFVDTLLSEQGCRRIVKTVYQAGYPYRYEEFKHRTKDSVNYVWRGKVYKKDGTYTYTTKGEIDCDTTWILHLMTDYTVDKDSTFCQGDTLYYKNWKIFETSTIRDSLLTHYGGDSVIVINFKAKERFIQTRNYSVCTNDPYPWPGHDTITFYGQGTYYDYHPTANEDDCDSLFIAYVTEGQPAINDTTILYSRWRDRDSLPYVWFDRHGKHVLNYTADVSDTVGVTTFGCDSINIIHLQIAEKYSFDTLKLCPDGEVVVNNVHYTQPGDYEQWFTRGPESTFTDSTLFIHIDSTKIHYNTVWDSITICQDQVPYAWHNRKCMRSGEYKDTIPALTPPYCDSIVYLRLKVNPTYLVPLNFNICKGQTAEYNHKQFPKGVHYDTLACKVTGCDSVIQLNVNEVPSYYWSDTVYFKKGGSYIWDKHFGNQPLTQEGIYYDSCRTHLYGCDSIYRLELREKPTYFFPETASICDNERPYLWRNQSLNFSGVYYDSLFTAKIGGDSVYQLTLTIYPTYEDSTDIFTCYGETIKIGNKEFRETGTYRDTLSTVIGGCDSVMTYHINFLKAKVINETGHLGVAGSFKWKVTGETLTQPGFYADTIPSVRLGCDSVINMLTLIKDSTYAFDTTVTICSNETFRWHGTTYTYKDAGDHSVHYYSIFGMDSIETLHLKVNPTKETINTINKCQGQSLIINKRPISQSGTYIDTYQTTLGCDSVVTSVVNFYPTYYQCDTIRMIAGTSVTWHDRIYTKPGTDTIHLTTSVCQCDSDLRVIILLADTFSLTETEVVCSNTLPYYWHGQEIYKSGTYEDRHLSVLQADSSYYLHLTVTPSYLDTNYVTLCPGGKTFFFGQTITQAGTYTHSLTSSLGCDSSFVLIVNMNELKHSEQYINLCYGESYPIGDTVFYTSGKYRFTTTTEDGCDSVVDYYIHIEPRKYFFQETKSINPGTSYEWHGITYSKAGIYLDSLTTVNGCDSVYKLTLTINPTYYFEETQSICMNETPYVWHGQQLTSSGIYYDSLHTQSVGLDSVHCLKLEVRSVTLTDETLHACSGEVVVMPDGTKFTTSSVYLDTLFESGCPQVIRYNINFFRSYHDTTYAVFCENSSYIWYGHFNDTVLTKDGVYIDYNTTTHGCDSVYVLRLTKLPKNLHDTTIFVCEEEVPYVHNGLQYSVDKDFFDTLHNAAGCDSIIITRYRLNDKCSNFELFMRCPTETLYIDEQPITKDGEYRVPLPGDSVHRFRVVSWPQYEFNTFLGDFCDSVTYKGTTYYARSNNDTVNVQLTWQTIHGCDSIEHLTLVLHRTAEPKTNSQDIFDYAYMIFDGIRYDKTGTYAHNKHTQYGCDSIVTLDLRVTPTDHPGSLLLYYCSGVKEDLVVFNKSYHPTKDTMIIDTVRYDGFGMMKIQIANVYVTNPFTIMSVEAPEEICASNPTHFQIHYNHKGFYPSQYELTFLPNQLVVTPNPQRGDINYKDYIDVDMSSQGVCVSPGEYPYRLRFTSNLCTISDTTIQGTIIVRYPNTIMESYWDNTIALINENYNEGKWKFLPPYNWKILTANGEDKTARINPNQNVSYISSNLLMPGDRITVSPMREGYKNAVPSCEYVFTYTLESGRVPILVYPTAVKKSAHITVESSENGTYSIYNETGHKLTDGTFSNTTQTIQVPASEGCYMLYLHPQNTGTQIQKLIVY